MAQRRRGAGGALGGAARGDLGQHRAGGAPKAAALDRIVSKVRDYPVVTALGVGAVALLGTRRIFEIATKVLTLYALFRR